MGLLLQKKENDATISIWKITESLTELRNLSEGLDDSHIKIEKRKKEFLSTRILLQHAIPSAKIKYNDNGSPSIDKNIHISISHSKNFSCIILSKKVNGIDIQKITGKSLNVAPKFISDYHLKNLTKEKASLIWSIKEAIFKWHKKKEVNFKKDIILPNFNVSNQGSLIVQFRKQKIICHYFKIENQYLSYVCK